MSYYEVVTSESRLGAIASEVSSAEVIALDTETTGLNPHDSKVRLLSLNTGKGIYVIDLFQTGTMGPLVDALRDTQAVVVMQNGKFDQKFLLHHYNLELNKIFDTYKASNLVYNGQLSGHDLYALYARELQTAPKAPDLGGSNWSDPLLTPEQLEYAAEDVLHLPSLRAALKPKIHTAGLGLVALIEFQAILPEAAMELNGLYLDRNRWIALAENNRKIEQSLRKQLTSELPHPAKQLALPGFDSSFNLGSPAQLLKSLQMHGLKLDNTNEMTLAMFAQEYPVVKTLLEWRGYSQAVKSFGESFLEYIHPGTGRIHTSYYPFTGAGRYSSSKPNLQQIPKAEEFRSCFRPAPGFKYVINDYSQVELRIAAEISGDETLIGVYARAEDAHSMTASIVAAVPIAEVTKDLRNRAKAVNFGLVYGMAAPKLVMYAQASYKVSMTLGEAELFRRRYFDRYSGIRAWHREIFSDENKRRGVTRTLAGRIRYLKAEAHNEYANSPVQGCLPASTRILTRAGYLPIGSAPETGEAWTGSVWAPYRRLYKGDWAQARVTLANGMQLRCDTRHKLLVVTEHGYQFRIFTDLRVGDSVALSPARAGEHGGLLLAPTDAYWMGFASGNGHASTRDSALNITFGDRKQRYSKEAKYAEWKLYVESRGYVVQKPRVFPGKITSTVQNTKFKSHWETLGYRWGVRSFGKRVPDSIWGGSFEARSAFLLGFLDADGYIGMEGRTTPSIHLCQAELLRDLQQIARSVGVESVLRGPYHYEDRTSWRLDLNGGQLAQLGYGTRARTCIQMPAPGFVCRSFLESVDAASVPPATWTRSEKTLLRRMRTGGKTSVYKLLDMVAKLGAPPTVPVYAYSAIVSLEHLGTIEPTYTLAVDHSSHRFDAEGFISKNSGADGMKKALRLTYDRLKKFKGDAKMVHMVHDEIITEARDEPELLKAVDVEVKQAMVDGTQPFLKRVPIVVEGGEAASWAEK